jgi:hypothetical protein
MQHNRIITANKVIYQEEIFPDLKDHFGYLTNRHKQFIQILDLIDIDSAYPRSFWDCFFGRPKLDRQAFLRAFIAMIIWQIPTADKLRERLEVDGVMRSICGFDYRVNKLPSKSTFSRAFAELSKLNIGDKVHELLIAEHCSTDLYEHTSIDASAIAVAERAVATKKPPSREEMKLAKAVLKEKVKLEKAALKEAKKQAKAALKTKNTPQETISCGSPELPKLKQSIAEAVTDTIRANAVIHNNVLFKQKKLTAKAQLTQTNSEIFSSLPVVCNYGSKNDSNGNQHTWKGYKLHIAVNDYNVPVASIVTSASTHDSLCAIPLIRITEDRIDNLYYLMDKGYDSSAIRTEADNHDKVALIDFNHRGNKNDTREFDSNEQRHYGNRAFSESCFSNLKMQYLPNYILYRGISKVKCLLNLALSVITATQIIKYA